MSKSSFCGLIEEMPFIRVDNFTDRSGRAYFLSHYHSDHYEGLNVRALPDELKKNDAYIYASEVTIAIIENEQNSNLLPYLKVLRLGRNTLCVHNENGKDIIFSVTALPAGHSIGSVMFLFEYEKITVLYTGDFRITQNDLTKYTHLHDRNRDPIRIDTLYVDTTFQLVPFFPRRSEVVRNVVEYVKNWLNTDAKNIVYLKTSAHYGYEVLANALYDATGIKTCISERKWRIFSQFPKEIYGVTDETNTRIFLGYKYSYEVMLPRNCGEVLNIHFSAMKWCDDENKDESFIEIKKVNEIDVCFATHCGRDELIFLVNYFNAPKVVGFPAALIRNSPVKMADKISPLKIEISKSSKRSREELVGDSEGDGTRSKKLSKETVKRMFDW